MAYAAIVSFAQTVDQILDHDRYSISLQERQQFIAVQRYAILLQEFLEDFPEKAQSLEGRIRDVAYEAEDKIEILMYERFHEHCGKKRYYYHFPELEKISEKIESIAKQVMNIKSNLTIKDEQQLSDSPSATSKIAPTTMIGLAEDLKAIKARVRGESPYLQIIPIVGMGGIGKTTLARNAFDATLITEHFDIRVWVTVSQDYCAQQILSGILLSIDETYSEDSRKRNESVEEKVFKSLKDRRYLIVMDDMWSEEAWDDLKWVFPDDCNGSRIMLTTRLSAVAAYPDPRTPHHEIQLMNADQSWDLLRHKLFIHKNCPPELENIGKKIATSCRGLPLAIVVIAGVLSMVSKTPSSWGKIAEIVSSTVAAKDGHLEKILSLSYNHLPHHLRPCFLYMGGFPEDYEIHVSKLVKLWVAEGFLRRKNGSKSLEEEAEEYLGDLVERNLIFVSKRKSNGKIKSCSVHDLVRNLCIRKAQEEKFLLHAEKVLPESMGNQRRLSVSNKKRLADTFDSTIRSIKFFNVKGMIISTIGKYKLLRVLFLVHTITVVDKPILFLDGLFHLRYLDLYHEGDLPAAISYLQNLQTLIIRAKYSSKGNPGDMVRMASQIWSMPQLRHLISYFVNTLPSPLVESSALTNLQTFSVSTNFQCNKDVLQRIPNLKKLGIGYGRQMYEVDYQLENLVYLHQLEKLKINIHTDFPYQQKLNLVFPMTLKKLTLSGWRLPWEGLQHWETESSHFPKLKSLLLRRCWCLPEIPNAIGEIPTLELIEVDNVNKSLVESAKGIQEEQKSWGNDGLQVRWVHS